jgi:hypothetical protein
LSEWSEVDCFSCYLAGPAWREYQIADGVVHFWARYRDRWWRRTALVSTVPLNNKSQGGTGDTARTLAVCRLLVDDRDDMVVKAMSWALRELSKRDPKSVEKFLDKHRDALAPRVVREHVAKGFERRPTSFCGESRYSKGRYLSSEAEMRKALILLFIVPVLGLAQSDKSQDVWESMRVFIISKGS